MSALPPLSDLIIPVGGVIIAFIAALSVNIADRRQRRIEREDAAMAPPPPTAPETPHGQQLKVINPRPEHSEGFAQNAPLPTMRLVKSANALPH